MVFEEATPTTPKPAEPYGTQEIRGGPQHSAG